MPPAAAEWEFIMSVFPLGAKELKIGILGMTEGNGHHYSWSEMFNGFDMRYMACLLDTSWAAQGRGTYTTDYQASRAKRAFCRRTQAVSPCTACRRCLHIVYGTAAPVRVVYRCKSRNAVGAENPCQTLQSLLTSRTRFFIISVMVCL